MATRPRVIVVDDDAAIRRLVELALEDLDIELCCVDRGEAALALLRTGPAKLLITDLMMPGLSGYALLQRLADEPALRGDARLAVFSAGLNAQARERLAGLPVWRLIDKPVSVFALAEAVEDAIAGLPADPDWTPVPPPPRAAPSSGEAAAIAEHFGGDEALFRAFREGCVAQFPDDIREAGSALAGHDAIGLRRCAHSLKSVLLLLGEPEASAAARRLEHAAEASDWPACDGPWRLVSSTLKRLVGP